MELKRKILTFTSVCCIATLCLVAIVSPIGCRPDSSNKDQPKKGNQGESQKFESDIRFKDVTAKSNIDFQCKNGGEAGFCTMLETLGGGVAVLDYDGNGLADLFFTGGGNFSNEKQILGVASRLYRNQGGFQFELIKESVAPNTEKMYSHGCWTGDFNNDGFPDLLISGFGGVQVFQNYGDGSFGQVADGGFQSKNWTTAAGWGDFDNDGTLDIFAGQYLQWNFDIHKACNSSNGDKDVCPPRKFDDLPDRILFSQGDGSFRVASEETGITEFGKALGALIADVDQDGDTDIYVANDTTANLLYQNDGKGKFREVAVEIGGDRDSSAKTNGSMGLDICDYDGDGIFDIGVANYESEDFALYRQRNGMFNYSTQVSGLSAIGASLVGWGTVFADLDRDGDQDMVMTAGHILYHPVNGQMKQESVVMDNDQNKFRRATFGESDYFSKPHHGRGLVYSDLDLDGDLDLVFANLNEPHAVLSNETKNENRSLKVRLVGTISNRDAIGATVELKTDKKSYQRQVTGGASFLSSYDRNCFFGIPKDEIAKTISVTWPGGFEQTIEIDDVSKEDWVIIEERK